MKKLIFKTERGLSQGNVSYKSFSYLTPQSDSAPQPEDYISRRALLISQAQAGGFRALHLLPASQ